MISSPHWKRKATAAHKPGQLFIRPYFLTGQLVYLLHGQNVRFFFPDDLSKRMQLFLVMLLNEAVGIQCDQFHVLSSFSSPAKDFGESFAGCFLTEYR